MVQLRATMEQTREMQLAQVYDVLGFRRVIARYDVLSTLHESVPEAREYMQTYSIKWALQALAIFWVSFY